MSHDVWGDVRIWFGPYRLNQIVRDYHFFGSIPWQPWDMMDLKVADMDGDGHNDVLITGMASQPAAEIFWRRGNGRDFYDPIYQHETVGTASYGYADLADLDGDGDLDAVVQYWDTTNPHCVTLLYNSTTNQLIDIPAALPYGEPAFARLDGDARWDLCLSNIDSGGNGRVFRGLGGFRFEPVQDLAGVTSSGFTRFFGPPYPDLISVGPGQVSVRRNIVVPAGVEGGLHEWPGAALSIRPSIASSAVEVRWAGPGKGPFVAQVVDATGRAVATRMVEDASWRWNLCDDAGVRLASGTYWVRMAGHDGLRAAGRLMIVR